MAPGSRTRYSGSQDAFIAVLERHVRCPNWLNYSESMQGPRQPAKLIKHKELWRELAALDSCMNFSQRFASECFEKAARHCGDFTWSRPLTEDELKDWKVAIAKQFRCACRHIVQAKHTNWCKKLLGVDTAPEGPPNADDSEPSHGNEENGTDGDQEQASSTMEAGLAAESSIDGEEYQPIEDAEGREEESPIADGQKAKRRLKTKTTLGAHEEWFVAFDYEIGKAYRCRTRDGNFVGEKEWATRIGTEDGQCTAYFGNANTGTIVPGVSPEELDIWGEGTTCDHAAKKCIWSQKFLSPSGEEGVCKISMKKHPQKAIAIHLHFGPSKRQVCQLTLKSEETCILIFYFSTHVPIPELIGLTISGMLGYLNVNHLPRTATTMRAAL